MQFLSLKDFNVKNITSFLEGNFNYYMSKVIKYPPHLVEQYFYRLYICKDTCLPTGVCESCGCPTIKKAFALEACSSKFKDFMPGQDWEQYKKEKNIDSETMNRMIKEIQDELQKRRV